MNRLVAILIVLFFCGQAGAASSIILRMNHQFPETAPGSIIDQWFADEIKKRTNGTLVIRIFWENGLGEPRDNLSLISRGVLDMAAMSPGYFSDIMPLTAAPNSIPMAMDNVCQASRIMSAMVDQIPALTRESDALGIKLLFFHVLNPYYLISRTPIQRLADIKGKRIRTWGRELPQLVKAAQAKPITLFLPDVYPAMEKGIIDACPFSLDLMVAYRLYEVASHVTEVILWEGPSWGIWISNAAWGKLSAGMKEILVKTAQEAREKELALVIQAEKRAKKQLREKGIRFHSFPEEDLARWKADAPDFFKEFIQSMTARGNKDAALKMVDLWKKMRQDINCP